jgi:hypothetical protein
VCGNSTTYDFEGEDFGGSYGRLWALYFSGARPYLFGRSASDADQSPFLEVDMWWILPLVVVAIFVGVAPMGNARNVR